MFLELSGFPLVLLSIIAFVIIIGLIITIHEAGHFFLSKRAGILCHEFSIGMGAVIFQSKLSLTIPLESHLKTLLLCAMVADVRATLKQYRD